jgi:ATP-binding cassette subfamily B (MDR/TAP) protein 1
MLTPAFEELNRLACESGHDTYTDPPSGYQVLTSEALRRQGKCCGNSCRHCPYGHINVETAQNPILEIAKPVLMNWAPIEGDVDILFWSGGKDSFLTLMHLLEEKRNPILLTSFGAYTGRVSIQDIHIKNIAKQAEFFKVPICMVPLYPNTDYKTSIVEALQMIQDRTCISIEGLVFGDLHLKDIRQWRVDTWPGYEVSTPLFDVPYKELLERLWRYSNKMNLSITLSTDIKISNGILKTGTPYTPELILDLEKENIDVMLENGEGHTLVFPSNWTPYKDSSL